MFFPYSRSCLRTWSRETGSAVPLLRQQAHLHTQAESDAYLRGSSRVPRRRPYIYLNRHTPSSQSEVYRVTRLRTDGVHCREPVIGPRVGSQLREPRGRIRTVPGAYTLWRVVSAMGFCRTPRASRSSHHRPYTGGHSHTKRAIKL